MKWIYCREPCRHHARELAIDQIGPDFALKFFAAPVANVFEQQQSQYDLGRRAGASPCPALLAEPAPGDLDVFQQTVIVERLIRMPHPGFPQIMHLFGDQPVGETDLRTASGDHEVFFLAAVRAGRFLAAHLLAVQRSEFAADLSKPRPGSVRRSGLIGTLGRNIERLVLLLGTIGEIQIRTMAARAVGVTGTLGLAARTGGRG